MCKRHAIGAAAALALLGQQGGALAQPRQDVASANYVMMGCRELIKPQSNDVAFTQGKCLGIVGAMFFFSRSRFEICTPDGPDVGQAVRVVITYIDRRPERMHVNFNLLALEAMQQAWPCRRQ